MIPCSCKIDKKFTISLHNKTRSFIMVIPSFTHLITLLQNIFFILIGLAGMSFLIGFHEFGHFLFAKLFKIRTPSFSIGFGPKIINKKIGETEFSLSAIPFG